MGIYQTLYAFQKACGSYMGDPGTHPWSQGFPRTSQLPNGPEMPAGVTLEEGDLRYPKAWGLPALREAIAGYYRDYYGADIGKDNVMIFAGGRPAILAALLFLQPDIRIRIASTEYTPYYDLLRFLQRDHVLLPSGEENAFRPPIDVLTARGDGQRSLVLMSNPCNPTGITRSGKELASLVEAADDRLGFIFDEAYELLHRDGPVSAAQYLRNLERGNILIIGAATKGLQAPGIRIGWAISSKENVEILGNFSSFAMGGVSHLSQRYALALFDRDRIKMARAAVPAYYRHQRERYRQAFTDLGLKLFTGEGGFYHWCKLPGNLTAQRLNSCLFKERAAVLEGTDCDMARLGDKSSLRQFFRFSFGPLDPASFESDIAIMRRALRSCAQG
jgi:aspartate/methionine/tyrosine aminotransferase